MHLKNKYGPIIFKFESEYLRNIVLTTTLLRRKSPMSRILETKRIIAFCNDCDNLNSAASNCYNELPNDEFDNSDTTCTNVYETTNHHFCSKDTQECSSAACNSGRLHLGNILDKRNVVKIL